MTSRGTFEGKTTEDWRNSSSIRGKSRPTDKRPKKRIGSQETLTREGSVLSLCFQDNEDEYDGAIGEELTLANLGFCVSKSLNWDGVMIPEKTSIEKAMQYRLNNYVAPDCEVVIGEDAVYRCHLLLLQCYSAFFDRTTNEKPILLPPDQVAPKVFEFVYKWMLAEKGDCYTMIRRDHIVDLLLASRYLEIKELEEQCEGTLHCEAFFWEGSAFVLYLQARDRGLREIQAMMVPKVRKFFLTIVCSLDFLEDLDVDDVCNFLSSDQISVHSELEVFMIGMRWLLHEWPSRRRYVREVMSCVRFGLMPPHQLVNIRRNTFAQEFGDVIGSDPEVLKMMDDGVAYSITKVWQAGEGQEFETCVAQQGLKKPRPRNWAKREKNSEYEKYEQFLLALAWRRREVKNRNKEQQNKQNQETGGGSDEPEEGQEIEMTEQSLTQIGYKLTKHLDWKLASGIREKSNIYEKLKDRVRNYINTDCVIILGEDFEYHCHSLLLQCYSQVCASLNNRRKIRLQKENVSPTGFELAYKWMLAETHDAHSLLRRDTLLEVYAAAQCLQIRELITICWTTISNAKFFYEGTAFLLYLLAKERRMRDIQQLMAPRIGKFFLTLVSSRDFLDLDVDDICAFLGSDNICVHSEIEVFMSAVRWLRHDWRRRKSKAGQVMSCVRFGLIPAWQLVDIRRNPENPEFLEVTSLPEVNKMIDNGLAFSVVKEFNAEDNGKNLSILTDQGIPLPGLRNWYDLKKDYKTYHDFLRELNFRRREHVEDSRNQKVGTLKSHTEFLNLDNSRFYENIIDNKQKDKKDLAAHQATDHVAKEKANIELKKQQTPQVPISGNQIIYMAGKNPLLDPQSLSSFVENESGRPQTVIEKALDTQRHVKPNEDRDNNISRNSSNLSHPSSEQSIIGPAQKGSKPLVSADHDSVLLFGGADPFQIVGKNGNSGRKIFRYNSDKNSWDMVGELPQPRHHHGVVFCRNRVYVVGGTDPSQKDKQGRSNVIETVWSLDVVTRIWHREENLTVARKDPGLVEVGGYIFAIGGRDKAGKVLRSVERYDPRKRQWDEAPPLMTARYAMGAVFHEGSIWVAGGTARNGDTTTVERLFFHKNRFTDKWVKQAPLRFARSFCNLVSGGQELYLVGGVSGTGADRTSEGDVDVWSGEEWRLRFAMQIPRHCQATAMLGNEMMIIGGVSTKHQACLKDVQVYCCQRKQPLKTDRRLPLPLSGHAAVTINKTQPPPN